MVKVTVNIKMSIYSFLQIINKNILFKLIIPTKTQNRFVYDHHSFLILLLVCVEGLYPLCYNILTLLIFSKILHLLNKSPDMHVNFCLMTLVSWVEWKFPDLSSFLFLFVLQLWYDLFPVLRYFVGSQLWQHICCTQGRKQY